MNTLGCFKQGMVSLSKPMQKNKSGISFSGNSQYDVNSRRARVDYGDDLYAGVNKYFGVRNAVFRTRANAEYANLRGKDLTNYCFSKSNFYKADLSSTILDYANFSDCNLWGSTFEDAKTDNTIFNHANLCDTKFNRAKFGANTSMLGVNIMGADFRDTDMSNVDLTNAIYNESTLFPENMPQNKFENMILLKDGADFSLPRKPVYGDDDYAEKRKRFEYAKIRYLSVQDVNFENNSLKRIDFKRSRLSNCNFKNTEISRGYLKGIIAQNCDFSDAKLKQVNFDEAEFTDVNMSKANLRGAILTYKSASNLNLEGAVYDQYTKFNEGFNPKKHGMIYQESDPAMYNAGLLRRRSND